MYSIRQYVQAWGHCHLRRKREGSSLQMYLIHRQAGKCSTLMLLMDRCACAGMHGRSLQGYLPFNNTGKDEAIAVSDARGKATAESIMDYIHKATPQAVRDLVTPVGNYTGQLHTLSTAQLSEAFHHSNHLSWGNARC